MNLLVLLLACATQPPPPMVTPTQAAPEPTATPVPTASRIVAFGDVHGDLTAAKRALKLGGLIDDEDNWAGGDTVGVQVGDQLDRGDDEPEILDLFDKLAEQAKAAGGAFYPLLGNHEIMNVAMDFRYVTEEGFTDFAEGPKEHMRGREESLPEHMRGRLAAFYPGGPYALKLAEHKVSVTVGKTVFVHGGILPAHVEYGLDRINEETQSWMRDGGKIPDILVGEDAPVWSRHYSNDPDPGDCRLARETLDKLGLDRIVVAHTVHKTGIVSGCDKRVWRVDTGMAKAYGGVVQVLEIKGDEVNILKE